MGRKTVHVKGHYRNQNGKKVWVSAYDRQIETDKPYDEWFNPQDHTGWDKNDFPQKRRRSVFESTDARKTKHNRYLEAGRKMQALANVNQDDETSKKAKNDADYFFKKAKRTKGD